MRAAEWALLEWLMPASVWLHLELFSVPNLVIAALLLATIVALAAAIIVVARGLDTAATAKSVALPPRTQAARNDEQIPARRRKPAGGVGPRAPSVLGRAAHALAQ